MILNGVMAVILCYFDEFGSFGTNYVKVVEDRPILSAKKCCQKIYFWQCVIFVDILMDYYVFIHVRPAMV